MSFFIELKRRNVFRMAVAYLAGAWLLVEVTDTLFSIYGLPDTAARIVVTLLAIGFPITLVLSWIYELTPEGLKLEKDVDRTVPLPRSDTRRLDRTIIVLLVLALGYFAFDKFVLEPARVVEIVEETAQQARSEALLQSFGDKSIVVLPFVNMSSDLEQEYFSDGISEELLNLLAQVPELRVISRSSAFSYKGKDIDVQTIAEQLDVAHVLEGSVRKDGNRVRITAQLIEARTDTHLWSQTYDREMESIFKIQDEIAGSIVKALRDRLGLVAKVAPRAIVTANTDAYQAYLKGRELVHKRNRDQIEEAISYLERAVRLDGDFAPAHAQLAIAILMQSGVSTDEKTRKALPLLDQAQEIEPDLAEAHGGRALLAYLRGDLDLVIEHARKALAVNPNYVDAMHWLRSTLNVQGRYVEANALLKEMLAADPLSVPARSAYAFWLSEQGRIEEAHAVADQILEQSHFSGCMVHASIAQLKEGKIAESIAWNLQATPDSYGAMWAFLWVGEFDEARRFSSYDPVWANILAGHWEAAIEEAQDIGFTANADTRYFAGRVLEALPYYESTMDYVPEGRPAPIWWNLSGTMRLAYARRLAGDEGGAQAAAEIVRKEHAARHAAGENNLELDLAEAMLAAFEHDHGRALEALQSAVRRGFLFMIYVDDPVFDELRDDPRFIALRREIGARIATEHEKVIQLVCFDNPVPDEWQPLPETCDGAVKQLDL